MRSSTLIALLPLLAATHAAAHRSHDHHHQHGDDEASININNHHQQHNTNKSASSRVARKSLDFGPVHEHARFVVPDQDSTLHEIEVGFDGKAGVNVARIARDVVRSVEGLEGAIEGEDYFVREDVSSFGLKAEMASSRLMMLLTSLIICCETGTATSYSPERRK